MKVSICGVGQLGSALALCLSRQGHSVELISRDSEQAAKRLSGALATRGIDQPPNLTVREYPTRFDNTDLLLLCVPDFAIESTCELLADRLSGREIVVHCSGSLDHCALNSAKQTGCLTASAHPLNTFPNLEASLDVLSDGHGSYLYCEGDAQALPALRDMFEPAGFGIRTIEAKNKVLYHAACVFASNYLTVLMDMSLQTARAGGIDDREFWQACQPIIRATLENLDHHPPVAALSGPITRGDLATMKRHISALSDAAPQLVDAYQVFADYAVSMLERNF